MEKIKVIECPCGEEIYENDYSRVIDGIQYLGCDNCMAEYPESALREVEVPLVTKQTFSS